MASRMSDYVKLLDRCRKLEPLGWKVEDISSGWRVLTPHGETFGFHKTYSDSRAWTTHMVELENRGRIKEYEARLRSEKLKARRDALKVARDAADAKAVRIAAQQQGAVAKAAGPYLTVVEECDLQWLTTPHPAPWMRWMYIDAKAAEYLLEHHNDDNRRMGEDAATRYAAIMLTPGAWHMTHQGIAIDTRGQVQDAQHRLRGIVKASAVNEDIKVPFAVFVGMPEENFRAIDEGRLRTASQMLAKAGLPGGTHLVTMMRAVSAYDSENPRGYNRGTKFTQLMAHTMWEAAPDAWKQALSIGVRLHKASGRCIPQGQAGAAYYLITRINGMDNIYVKAFFEGMIANRKWRTQLVLPDDDPRNTCLGRFKAGRPLAPIEGVFWFVTAWNNFVRGHHPMNLRFNERTEPPRVLMCKPGEGIAPRAVAGELAGLEVADDLVGLAEQASAA